MLTLQVLFPMAPMTLRPHNQAGIDRHLESVFRGFQHEVTCSEDGKDFIRTCLSFDPGKRPTAYQAFCNRWFWEPAKDRELFERREDQSTSSWRTRRITLPVVQLLDTNDPPADELSGVFKKDGLAVTPHFAPVNAAISSSTQKASPRRRKRDASSHHSLSYRTQICHANHSSQPQWKPSHEIQHLREHRRTNVAVPPTPSSATLSPGDDLATKRLKV